MIFKTIDSSIDSSRKTLALFNKDWNTYKSNFTNASGGIGNKIATIFSSNDLNCLKEYNNQLENGIKPSIAYKNTMTNCTTEAKKNAVALAKGTTTIKEVEVAQNAAKTSTIGLTIAQTALNAAIGLGIGAVVTLVTTGISKLVNAQEDAIEKADEAISKFNEQRESLSSNKSTIDEISSDYARLAQGVDSLGRNVSLNTEEYSRYNEIVNKIADMFPQMVQGYTDEGNAIIANKGNVEALTQAYQDQKKAYQDSLIVQSADTFKGYKSKVDYDANISWEESGLFQQKDFVESLLKVIDNKDELIKFLDETNAAANDFNGIIRDQTLDKAGIKLGIHWDTEGTAKEVQTYKEKLLHLVNTLDADIQTETAKIKPIMQAYMEQSYDYQKLDSEVQDVVSQIVGQFDSEFYRQFDNENEMASWITENIVSKFQGVNGKEIADSFSNVFDLKTQFQNGEITLDKYLSAVQSFKTLIDGFDDDTKKSVELIFSVNGDNGNSVNTMVNNVKKKLDDEFDDKVGELTLEDLQIASKLEIPEGTLLSWDELIAKIKEAKEEAQNTDKAPVFSLSEDQSKSIDDFQTKISTLKTALEDLSKGDLSSSAIMDLLQEFPELQGQTGNLEEAIKSLANTLLNTLITGLGDSATPEVVTMLENLTNEAINANLEVTSLSGALSQLIQNAKLVSKVNDEINDSGLISGETLSSIVANYPKLEQAVAKYQAGLISEIELFHQLENAYVTDENNYKTLLKEKLVDDEDFYSKICKNSEEYYAIISKAYEDDYENWKSVAEAKAGIEQELLTELKGKWNDYFTAIYDEESKLYSLQGGANSSSKVVDKDGNIYDLNQYGFLQDDYNKAEEKAQKAVDKANSALQALDTTIDLKLGSFNWNSLGVDDGNSKDSVTEIDFIENKLNKLKQTLENQKKKAEEYSTYKKQNNELDKTSELIDSQITSYNKAYDAYINKADNINISESLKDKVRNGAYSIKDYDSDTANLIQQYETWYNKTQDVKETISGLKEEQGELSKQKIDYIQDDYDKRLSYQDALAESYKAELEYRKALGEEVDESDYDYLINREERKKYHLNNEYDAIENEFNALLKNGDIEKYSDDWYYYKEILVGIKTELKECDNNILEVKEDQRQIKWDNWQKGLDKIQNLNDEIGNTIELLNSDDIYDENGEFTKNGTTLLTLYMQQLSTCRKEIKKYDKAISMLNKELENGEITQDEYNKSLNEYKSAQYGLANDIKSIKDTLIDYRIEAIEKTADTMRESIETETDSMRDLIESKKDALQAEKDLNDYKESIAEKQKNIVSLQSKIASLERSDSAKDQALARELKNDLAEEEKNLADEIANHNLDTQVDALDKELNEFEDAQDKKIKVLEESTEKQIKLLKTSVTEQQKVFDDMLSTVTENYTTTFENIASIASEYGIKISNLLTTPLSNIGSLFSSFTNTKDTSTSSNSISKANKSAIENVLKNGDGTGGVKSDLNKYVMSTYGGGKKYLSFAQMAYLSDKLGLGDYEAKDFKGNDKLKNKLLKALQNAGFSSGGMIEKGSSIFGNDNVLFRGQVGESILTKQNTSQLQELIKNVQPLNHYINLSNDITKSLDGLKLRQNNLGGQYHIDSILKIENVEGDVGTGVERKIESAIRNIDLEKQLGKITNKF